MRTLGVAVLGLFLGLLAGLLIFGELVGRIVVANKGSVEAPWTFVIGFGQQGLAIAGLIAAIVIDHRRRAGTSK
ncbi:hypothetical protein E1263_04615 [Kribbella antibiotica]|uniref:Uncharacterized protein n=1 Tax=Kribbella antibiotica TaxID=190195 RepID=A0A4R4ZSY6_9ACTN|nr:hypothetical protein [Kribbella antibiotica]TDD62163.1 hypothetical protein E1263_04615 [Kribbella antibiotica]